ncbi:LysR family transcriptional regulator [Dongia soli]|uniref:LysR family transcriptional regulator n=1 Tax=Dongia soli TaxID=600628 RepID=A0ABU5EAT2_9PROT|nr:LysR family transcriptional regulator [Dongia soli]MDY0883456.1 LysR family transcriptional regulator [Dongia soli]
MQADWDDLRVFLTLAREGSLTAAARKLEVSHPTIARRVKALEMAIGARLFDRLPDRFVITPAGEGLLADVQSMERAAESIHRRSANLGDTAHGVVRLSAGEAMTAFLARSLPLLRDNLQCIEFELNASHMLANLSRREADLLIREQVPDLGSIVSRRLGRAAYAIYGAATLPAAKGEAADDRLRAMTWIGFDDDHAYMPGQAWMRDLLDGKKPIIRVNNWLVLQEAVRSGTGVTVLPCYLGDADPGLRRIGGVLEDVAADQFLLVHRDLRSLPRIRAVMDAVIRLFHEQRPALEGKAPKAARRPGSRDAA